MGKRITHRRRRGKSGRHEIWLDDVSIADLWCNRHCETSAVDTGVCEIKAAGPYTLISVEGFDLTKSNERIWFGDIDAPQTLGK